MHTTADNTLSSGTTTHYDPEFVPRMDQQAGLGFPNPNSTVSLPA